MTDKTLTRALFESQPIKKFEEEQSTLKKMAVSIRDISLKDIVHHVYHTQTVGIDDSLVQAKILDDVVRGAEEDEGIWRQACRVFPMTAAIERFKVFTPDDIKFAPWKRGVKPQASGGSIWSVKFDCSQGAGLYALDVGFDKDQLKQGGFDGMEEALWAVGQAAGRKLLAAIVSEYTTDVDSNMTDTLANWGNAAYDSLVKMESLVAAQGMTPDVALVNPAEGYLVGTSDKFIRDDYRYAGKGIPSGVHILGSLFGRIPIYRHRDITENSMIMAAKGKSVFVGMYQDLQVENYNNVQEGLEGAVVSLQYDVKSGNDAEGPKDATSPLAKAWCVCTSA